jgi:serine/threonine protein kinase
MVHAHNRNIVHGFLHPDCIFIDANHHPKVCGFGKSRQADGDLAQKADVFSFSMIVYAVVADNAEVVPSEAVEQLEKTIASRENGNNSGELAGISMFLAKLIQMRDHQWRRSWMNSRNMDLESSQELTQRQSTHSPRGRTNTSHITKHCSHNNSQV